MIIRASMRNFLSFDEENELSMVASKVSSHPEQLFQDIEKPVKKVLKLSLIFGPNASGKSNVVKAIDFIRRSVTGRISAMLPTTTHFKLQDPVLMSESRLEIDFKCDNNLYRYGFLYDSGRYPEEWLYQITPTKLKPLFLRKANDTKRVIDWGESEFNSKKDKEFYEFVNRGTPDNRLLLRELRQKQLPLYKSVYKWFDKLVIIYPNTRRGDYLHMYTNMDLQKLYRDTLISCDTGISDIRFIDVDQKDVERNIPEQVFRDIILNTKPLADSLTLIHTPRSRYIMGFKNKMPFFKMMTFIHDIPNSNKQVEFDFPDESDGTIRLLDLIPLLGDVKNNRIVVIDELDRSLHPKLTKHIIETCVSNSEKNESQLIATSHDINLLDPSLLRRDAIWFVRKNQNMGSTLYSLEEFKTRNDKDLRNAYMEGLYGAIPYV